jgi:hypothetical protein
MAVAPAFQFVGMNWDRFQREALSELGHSLYRLRADDAPAVPVQAEPVRIEAPAGVDPLWRALVRAAGTDALPEVALEALRGDPAAKRALWPRLRALRAAHAR